MKKSNIYFSLFFVLMVGSLVPLSIFTDSIFGIIGFLLAYVMIIPVVIMMLREENKERKIQHNSECKCDCGKCCIKIKLDKKTWWNRN